MGGGGERGRPGPRGEGFLHPFQLVAPQPDSQWVCVPLRSKSPQDPESRSVRLAGQPGSPPPADKQLVMDFKRTDVTLLLWLSG